MRLMVVVLLALLLALCCVACGASDATGPTAFHRLRCDGARPPADCVEE